ncbi:thiamine ABC transporter substrate binding subunit [Microvirga sp. TS319]|uniref:thiamine ABC transporter substrate binding subunit n=1 Tax=Microvirga sp. TS319 TaxID=3241165 RepID=UPI003519FF9B
MLRRTLLTLASLALAANAAFAQSKPVLTVYTYGSFAGKYGPGKTVKERFEATCGCELTWVTAEDAGSLVGRLRLEGTGTKADVVLGLDVNLAAEAKALDVFAPHGMVVKDLALPIAWSDDTFIPFDWGYYAFVYDSDKLPNPPKSLKELVENPNGPKVVLQDPRTSAPGLGLLLWMQKVYGDKTGEAWSQLKPRIVTFTKGWSEAYGLFLKGEADMVMSYTTSPAYHIAVEKKSNYKAAIFSEGHYMQVEIAGMTRTTRQPELAKKFMAFLLSEPFQSAMPEGNWMLPVKTPAAGLPAAFKDLAQPQKALLFTPEEVLQNRRAFTDTWLNATAR